MTLPAAPSQAVLCGWQETNHSNRGCLQQAILYNNVRMHWQSDVQRWASANLILLWWLSVS